MYPHEPCLRRLVDEKLDFERTVLSSALHDAVDPIFSKGDKSIKRKSLKRIREAYDKMEDTVSKTNISSYVSILVGDHITVADLCCIATVSALNTILPIDFQRKDPEVAMKLYKNNMSPPSLAVVMTIQALGIKDVDYVDVDLSKGENLTEEFKKIINLFTNVSVSLRLDRESQMSTRFIRFLSINPLHTVPVLVDDDFIIWDSHAIAGYLISAYGSDESWYPRDPERRAVIDQRLHFDSGVLLPAFLEAEVRYSVPILEVHNALVNPLELQMFIGSGGRLLSGGSYVLGNFPNERSAAVFRCKRRLHCLATAHRLRERMGTTSCAHDPPAESSALSRASLGIQFLLATKHHARQLFYKWLAESKRRRINPSDEFCEGRPSTAVNQRNVDAVRRMVETDRHMTYHEIRASLDISMSQIQLNQSYRNIKGYPYRANTMSERNSLWRDCCIGRDARPAEETVEEYEKHVSYVTGEELQKCF
ncbi:Glutathione S-transferase 1 [Eumeta japonica]|uniref:Glutathione S-transferase 1 n=1 Tax=Eumeta variegata TaxID=151549 RepID=A0A4C1TWN4_EUMVA|nr:Glutathione S-transferase 1 [Eumeta japonica]